MDPNGIERRLAAIFSADAVGYSRLMAEDEAATIRTLTAYRNEISSLVGDHRGRVVDAPGDNVLAEFRTALDAVACAVEVQRVLRARNTGLPEQRRLAFRIGIHLGDIRIEGSRVYGDGVNIAARLERLAEAGEICISGTVNDLVRGKLDLEVEDLGEQEIKNIPEPVRAVRIRVGERAAAPAVRSRSGRIAVIAALAVVVALAAVWLARTFGGGDREAATAAGALPTAIAVLPFVNMSADREQEYFADGMTEELINALSKVEGLRVAARTSAFAFKGKNEDIRTIGRQLDVGAVVEGSVRKQAGQVRITAQLVRVADGFHIWSDTYDRTLEDVFAIQDGIARAIVSALKIHLVSSAPLVQRATEDLRAYELYLTGRHFWNQRTEEGFRKAVDYFERALEADPDYALAYVGLADSHLMLTEYGHEIRERAFPKAEAAATRALTLDESLGEAHTSLGFLRTIQWRWDEAEREFRRALELNPGYATAHLWYALLLARVGRGEEGLAEAQRALELDPLSPIINRSVGEWYLLVVGDSSRAAERLQRTLELNPNDPRARVFLTYASLEQGLTPDVFEGFVGQGSRPDVEAELRAAYQEGGLPAFMRKSLELRIAETQKPCTDLPDWAAWNLARLGDSDRMFECLQRTVDQRGTLLILTALAYQQYRADPRFASIVAQVGLDETRRDEAN